MHKGQESTIPYYVNPAGIKSKYAEAIARMTDYVWWLFNHRNYIVTLGSVYHPKDPKGIKPGETISSLGGGTILRNKADDIRKSIDEVIDECKQYIERNIQYRADGLRLTDIYVNGGNGKDKPGIPIYHIAI